MLIKEIKMSQPIDAEFEVKLFQKWGMNSNKIDSIINSWKHKQEYSVVYNKIRTAKKRSSPDNSSDEKCSPPKEHPPAILFQVN
jgi:hypothetical protein